MLLLTRPNHDQITTYCYYWSEYVVNIANKKGIKVFDLKGNKALRRNFESYIKAHNPLLIFMNGHGSTSKVCGHDNEPLLDLKNCNSCSRNAIFYVRSCDAGALLGYELIKNGAKAFIGYKNSFYHLNSKDKRTLPLTDPISKLFLEPSNLVPISILIGNSVKEAYIKSQDAMKKNFFYAISSKATQEEHDAAQFIWMNYSSQVIFGDGNARLP